MKIKRWITSPLDKENAAGITQRFPVSSFLAMLLDIRGFRSDKEIKEVLRGRGRFSEPLLMKDMEKAAARIREAVDSFERIAIYGDYDADGVTATAIVFSYLEALGADVIFYIPQREGEGYGMNPRAVESLHERGVKLIVTVDNGISSVEEVALANSLGMDVVITDHHRPHEKLPQAYAIVDAYQEDDKSPFKDFSGAGVALKLVMAIESKEEFLAEEFGDLAALGSIGDAVPLRGENRLIVIRGLKGINEQYRPGIAALLGTESLNRPITSWDLAFTAIPRLNATGRMGSPDRAVKLLTCVDDDEIRLLSEEIIEDNETRKAVEAEISKEVMERIESDPMLLYSRVIVVSGQGWHHGVIGIVAARVTEKYGKPCFVISEDGEEARGSGRSVEGFSLFDATASCARLLVRFGGHPMAAGITIETKLIPEFREEINNYAKRNYPVMPAPVLSLDFKLNPSALNTSMPKDINVLEPFGNGNPKPLFGLYGMKLTQIKPVSGGKHLRLSFEKNGSELTAMRFGMAPSDFPFEPGEVLDLAVQLDLREYRGSEELTVNIRDMRVSGLSDEECLGQYRLFEKFRRGEVLDPDEASALLPDRNDLAAVYRLLGLKQGRARDLFSLLKPLSERGVGLGKFLVSLEALGECGLADFIAKEPLRFVLPKMDHKVDIMASPVIKRLADLAERRGG